MSSVVFAVGVGGSDGGSGSNCDQLCGGLGGGARLFRGGLDTEVSNVENVVKKALAGRRPDLSGGFSRGRGAAAAEAAGACATTRSGAAGATTMGFTTG